MTPKYTESTWAMFAGIRFLLAAIVLVTHLAWFAALPHELVSFGELGGRAAVLGFLIISGISIGNSYLLQPQGYFRRRFLRIYPLYFFSICLPQLLLYYIGTPYKLPGIDLVDAHWKTFVVNLFFLQGFLSIPIPSNLPVWSLSVEVFYYLLLPLLVSIRQRGLVLLIAISLIAYALPIGEHLAGCDALRYGWPWLMGLLLVSTKKGSPVPIVLVVVGVFIVSLGLNKSDTDTYSTFTFGLTALAVVFLINFNLHVPNKLQRFLNFLGELSFPLYLFHVPLFLFWYHFFGIRNAWLLIGVLGLSIIPLNYMLDYWLKRNLWKPFVSWVIQRKNKIITTFVSVSGMTSNS